MNTETNVDTPTEVTPESGAYKFELDLDKQYQRLEDEYKEHKAKAREHTAQASEINRKMKKLDAERKRQQRRLKDILE